jgi:parallel beta-helix repeat protein
MTKGIVGIQGIFGAGGIGQSAMIDIETYLKRGLDVPPNVIFVSSTATGGNNGTSWTDAYTDLQTAIDSAVSGQQVWVKQGTYYPSVTVGGDTNSDKAFYLKNGVAVYGGFSGADYVFENRNYLINETICDANGGYHVFHMNSTYKGSLNRTAILDGFTISGGRASSSDLNYNRRCGGGFNIANSCNPTIRNCKITNNKALYGLGVWIYYTAYPKFQNCKVYDNDYNDTTYAIMFQLDSPAPASQLEIVDCEFYRTTVKTTYYTAIGFGANAQNVLIDNCKIYDVRVGIRTVPNTASQTTIVNRCLIYNCWTGIELSTPTNTAYSAQQLNNSLVYNCTVGIETSGGTNNSNPPQYNNITITACTSAIGNYSGGFGHFRNTILYGNTAMYNYEYYDMYKYHTWSYCNTQVSKAGTGNISVNPNWDTNFKLNAGSPCVDTGNNTYVYGDYDLAGNTRIINTTVDMGCYERQ